MGWSRDNQRKRRFTRADMAEPANRQIADLGVDGVYSRPPARAAESAARTEALRGIGYRGPIDQDGYPAGGPGADPGGFATRPGATDGPGMRSVFLTAWSSANYDGGWDGDAGGAGPLDEWWDARNSGGGDDVA